LTTARLAEAWGAEQTGTALRSQAFSGADMFTGFAFAPDGQTLALFTLEGNRPLSLWNVGTGRPRRLLGGSSAGLGQGVFTPDGKRIIAPSKVPNDLLPLPRHLKFWDVASGKESHQVLYLYPCLITGLCLSPGGKLLAASGNDTIKVWETADLLRPERAKQPAGCR
jgi:WD40 repeat protein